MPLNPITGQPLLDLDTGLPLPDSSVPVSPLPGIIAAQPSTMAVSDSIDKSSTSALLATMQQSTASNPNTTAATTTGWQVSPDENGVSNVVIGNYGATPDSIEAAGFIKPGSAALVNSLIAGGTDVETAMPPNIWTGQQGTNDFYSYVNSTQSQASTAVSSLQQSQTQLTDAGVITGSEDSSQISGLVLSGATQGVSNTISAVNSINSIVPGISGAAGGIISCTPGCFGIGSSSPISCLGAAYGSYPAGALPCIAGGVYPSNISGLSGVTCSLGSLSGSLNASLSGSLNSLTGGKVSSIVGAISGSSSGVLSAISSGNFAAGSVSVSLGGINLSLSALSKIPSLASLTAQVQGASASAFYAIAASFKPMQAGIPQNLTALAKQAASVTFAASSLGGSSSISGGLSSLSGSISGSISGAIGGVSGSISGAIGGVSGSVSGVIGGVSGCVSGVIGGVSGSISG